MVDIPKLLRKFGKAGFVLIRPGAISMNTLITVGFLVVCGIVALKLSAPLALLLVVVVAGAFAGLVIIKNFDFAEKYPHIALMDGSDLAAYLMRDVAAKGEIGPPPADTPVVENPVYREISPSAEDGHDAT